MRKGPHSADKILVITLTGDVHIPFVTKHLTSEVVVVDPTRILDKCELSFYHDSRTRTTTPVYDGRPIQNIKSVWYRRPYIPEREGLQVPEAYKNYAYSAVRRQILDLYGMFQNTFWLSDYYTILKAETKPRQLELAAQLGFRMPKTLSTTSSKAAASFLGKMGDVVAKSMATTLPIVDEKVRHFYTTKIPAGEKINLQGLHLGPTIFQEIIDVDEGLRVTVVGDQTFTAAVRDIGHDDRPAIIDRRRAYTAGKIRFNAYDLPKSLQDRCVALTKALGLRFGAIDLLLDKKGRHWFLEISPNGQWAFVEDDTGLPIGKAIADLLERKDKNV